MGRPRLWAVTSTSSSPADVLDCWQHYGASSNGPRAVGRLYWDWYQRMGPGDELLGDLTGRTVAELGAGAGHQAAYVATELKAAHVIAIDSSAAQHSRSCGFYEAVPRLDFVHEDAAAHLQGHPSSLDIAYSVFGALDFSDPQALLPAAAVALRPGGTLVFSTLAHYRTGAPPETECRPADIPARMPDGSPGTMQRWVLESTVWTTLLDEHGFDLIDSDTVHDPGPDGGAPMATGVFRARRRNPHVL
ncbi:Methyltransferase domain-containing protein [Streptomyces sp. ScaeMP-e83]|nr:methyltransferase domain-containing protein [Streptomyces sp. SID4937]SCD36575.1 Methyltransferase domain-containing protein [Streptomyces sp. ScaeMP-e83]